MNGIVESGVANSQMDRNTIKYKFIKLFLILNTELWQMSLVR